MINKRMAALASYVHHKGNTVFLNLAQLKCVSASSLTIQQSVCTAFGDGVHLKPYTPI